MSWIDARNCGPDDINDLRDLHDLNAGVIFVPARPTKRMTPRSMLMDVLRAMGKEATQYGPPIEYDTTRLVTGAWLTGEAVHTALLVSAQRWAPHLIDALRELTAEIGCRLVPIVTALPSAALARHLTDTFGKPTVTFPEPPEPAGRKRPAPLEAPYDALRACRLPHMAATAIALAAGASAEDLITIPTDSYQPFVDVLTTRSGPVTLPPGACRYLSALHHQATASGTPLLFTRFGKPMSTYDITYTAMRAFGETGFVPAQAA